MSAKKGIAKHGDIDLEAVLIEFLQPRGMDAFVPMRRKDLTKKQRKNISRATSVIKEKDTEI